MSIEEGAKFVAAAYAVILAVLVIYYVMSARRVNTLQRDVELLEQESPAARPAARSRRGMTAAGKSSSGAPKGRSTVSAAGTSSSGAQALDVSARHVGRSAAGRRLAGRSLE